MSVEKTIEELANEAAEFEDQSLDNGGGDFEYELPAAGVTVGRLVEYIELGKKKRAPYQGKAKADAEVVRLTFELLSPLKNKKTYKDTEGNEQFYYETISTNVTKIINDKAKYKKLYNKMDYGRGKKHMAQMLGDAFILTISHNVSKKTGQPDKTYANLWNDKGDIGIAAPFQVDALSGVSTPIPVPPQTKPLRLFIFERPTKATWDSLFIDGTRDEKDKDGNIVQVSKNWLQQQILEATNFKGSPLEVMLNDIPELKEAMQKAEEKAAVDKPDQQKIDMEALKVATAAKIKELEDAARAKKEADAALLAAKKPEPVLSEMDILKAKLAKLEAEAASSKADADFVRGEARAEAPLPEAVNVPPKTETPPVPSVSSGNTALSEADQALAALGFKLG